MIPKSGGRLVDENNERRAIQCFPIAQISTSLSLRRGVKSQESWTGASVALPVWLVQRRTLFDSHTPLRDRHGSMHCCQILVHLTYSSPLRHVCCWTIMRNTINIHNWIIGTFFCS